MLDIQSKTVTALRELAFEKPIKWRIQGDCMAPLLRSGSSVEVVGKRFYWPGDVVIVHGVDGRLFAHRLIGCYVKSGRVTWLTQADTANRPDCAVLTQQIIGRVCGGECSKRAVSIPILSRLQSAGGFLCFVAARLLYCFCQPERV